VSNEAIALEYPQRTWWNYLQVTKNLWAGAHYWV